jgi:hypothetical protein
MSWIKEINEIGGAMDFVDKIDNGLRRQDRP